MSAPHIWIPKIKILEPRNPVGLRSKFRGFFTFYKSKADYYGKPIPGSRRLAVPQFENIVVNSGLNSMGDSIYWFRGCHVGDGAGVPAPTDASLQNYIAGQGSKHDMSLTPIADSSGIYIRRTATWRFPLGSISNKNISEVGITGGSSNANAAGNTNFTLWCRSLVVDSNGNPVAIPVLDDEILDVEYECRLYVPETTTVSEFDVKGVTTEVQTRAAYAMSTNQYERWWYGTNPTTTSYIGSSTNLVDPTTGSNPGSVAGFFTGGSSAIGPTINDSPTGSRIQSGVTVVNDSYVQSSYQNTGSYRAGLDAANDPDGIGALLARSELSLFQIGFSPRIQKTSDEVLNVDVTHSWARHE